MRHAPTPEEVTRATGDDVDIMKRARAAMTFNESTEADDEREGTRE
ncbi:hypothetical protein [Natrinema salinisoli]|nr:hypothetical protein [Natrinema salinisoli]